MVRLITARVEDSIHSVVILTTDFNTDGLILVNRLTGCNVDYIRDCNLDHVHIGGSFPYVVVVN